MDLDKRRAHLPDIMIGLGALCFGVSPLVVAISLGANLVTSWFLIFFNALLLIASTVVAIVSLGLLVLLLIAFALRLGDKHPAAARAAKAHRPAIGAAFVLAASVLPSAGGPFFGNDALLATGISIVMTVLLFVAAGFMTDTRPWGRYFGFILWYVSAISLPLTVCIYHDWDIAQMARTAGIHTPLQVALLIIVSLAILILPRWTPGPA